MKERNRRLNERVQPDIQSKASLGKAIYKFSSQSWLSERDSLLAKMGLPLGLYQLCSVIGWEQPMGHVNLRKHGSGFQNTVVTLSITVIAGDLCSAFLRPPQRSFQNTSVR